MCFGRIILPIETNESTVFLLNFNFNTGAIQVYNSSFQTSLIIHKLIGKKVYIITVIVYYNIVIMGISIEQYLARIGNNCIRMKKYLTCTKIFL